MRKLTEDVRSKIIRGIEIPLMEVEIVVDEIYENYCIEPDGRFHSFFFHEVCPLVSIAKYVGNSDTFVTFCESNSACDGKIRRNDVTKCVEFTAAIDGHNESLMMELVNNQGSASIYQKLQPRGKKGSRVWGHIEENAVSSDSLDKQLRQLLLDCLRQKVQRSTSRPIYQGAWLGIVFDSWPVTEDRQERLNQLWAIMHLTHRLGGHTYDLRQAGACRG